MTNQEIIEAIEAEINLQRAMASNVKLGTKEASHEILVRMAYVNGLRFAKEIIEKRIEVTECK